MSENELTPTEHDVQYVVTTSDGQPEQGLIAITGHTRDAIIASLMNSSPQRASTRPTRGPSPLRSSARLHRR